MEDIFSADTDAMDLEALRTVYLSHTSDNAGVTPVWDTLTARIAHSGPEIVESGNQEAIQLMFDICRESRAGLCPSKEFCEGAPYRGVRSTEQNFLRGAKDKREREHVYEISGLVILQPETNSHRYLKMGHFSIFNMPPMTDHFIPAKVF